MSKTIIDRMQAIARKMNPGEDSENMPIELMGNAMADIKALGKTLGMTPVQVVLLTAIVRCASRYCVESSAIARTLDIDFLQILAYGDDMEALRQKGYIRIDKDGDVVVPRSVLDSIKKNRPVEPLPRTGLDAHALLSRMKRTLAILADDQCTMFEAYDDITDLLESNPGNSVSRVLRELLHAIHEDSRVEEGMVLFGLVYRFWFEDDDMVGWRDIDDYFEEHRLDYLRSRYRHERLRLQRNGVIEYSGRDGLIDKDFFRLSDEVKDAVFEDAGGVPRKERSVSAATSLKCADLVRKELFYNPSEGRQVAHLKELLSPGRFDAIRAKMKEKGMRSGFACLFYGAPGTGKTETVYQVARECGRDIFVVDVAKVKSCWVGESEKNMRAVFDKYRQCVAAGGTVPILLFNEADAIFGIRAQGAEKAVDKMENSIQNIILQEMESLDGILIATTNLTSNLDKAFERRFLYKVCFDKPSAESRSRIWSSMIPSLTEEEASRLAAGYDFSGGQIENIARKREVKALISTDEPTFQDILEFCAEETLGDAPGRVRIGF